MKTNRTLSSAVILGLVSLFATADVQAYVYLRPTSVDVRKFPSPPRPGSAADRDDLQGVRRTHKTRTRAQCEEASAEATASLKSLFGAGRAVLNRDELALVDGLYEELKDDAGEFIEVLKEKYRRPRPFQRDPNIRLCVPTAGGFSYPSGHATLGRVAARAFGLIFADRVEELLDRGDEFGDNRVVGGVHHPKDIEAGRMLGDQVFRALAKSPKFMQRIEKIRSRLPHRDRARYVF